MAGSRETDFLCTTRTDARHMAENNLPCPGSAPATIKLIALQTMYGEYAFKPLALPYCFKAQIKQEDAQLVHIQEVAGLLGGVIITTMVAPALLR